MATVIINGKSYSGNNITVINNKVIVDGKDATPEGKEINIVVEGNISDLNVDACNRVTVTGSVKKITTMSGDVEITGDVDGDINTMSGNVDCNMVGGSVSSMSGNVKHKK